MFKTLVMALALPLLTMGAAQPEQAVRIGLQTQIGLPPVPPPAVGIQGKYLAPYGLSDCENAEWYNDQWGLPERFDGIVYRESRCINREDIKTFCCHSRYQLWIDLHLDDHRIAPLYAECGVASVDDVNSDTELDKQRAACAAYALYSVVGANAWDTA